MLTGTIVPPNRAGSTLPAKSRPLVPSRTRPEDRQRRRTHQPLRSRRITPSAEALVRLAETFNVSIDHLLIDDVPRRPLRAPENALGDRLAAITELVDEAFNVLNGVIDGLLARTRLTTLTGGLN